MQNREPKPGEKPAAPIDTETMLRGAAGELSVDDAASWLGDDLERLAELIERWPVRSAHLPGETHPPTVAGVRLAVQLWQGGKKDEAARWLAKLFAANDADIANAEVLRGLLLEALALRGDRAAMVQALARALREAAAPAGEMIEFPKRDFFGDQVLRLRPLRPLLRQAAALGLTDELRATMAAEGGPLAADLALLLRLETRDAAALAELSARLEKTFSPQMLEELAELLAPWPEAREHAQKILRLLEPAHAFSTPPRRLEQLARHGSLAAQCGMPEAAHWLEKSHAAQKTTTGNRPKILFDLLEGFSLLPPTDGARRVAEELAQLAKSRRWSDDIFMEGVRELAAAQRTAALKFLLPAFAGQRSFEGDVHRRIIAGAAHTLAARAGRWKDLTPSAWLKDTPADGTSEVGWALGWWTGGEGEGQTPRLFHAPDLAGAPPGAPLRVELFFGRESDRLERLAVVKNAGPAGVGRGPLPAADGFLAASISMVGRTVLGRATPLRAGKNLLPPFAEQLAKLPAQLWSRAASGPEGEALRGLRLFHSSDNIPSLAVAELPLPALEGQDLAFSGWLKGGAVDLGIVLPDGRRRIIAEALGRSEPQVWTRMDVTVPAQRLAEAQPPVEKGARYVLLLAPGGEYSGLRVTAMAAGSVKGE